MKIQIAVAQIAPVWMDKRATIERVLSSISDASQKGCSLVVFGEAVLPGYPWWLSWMGGSKFDDKKIKSIYSHYAQQSISIQDGDLQLICELCKKDKIAVYLGIVERPPDRGGHSLYCSLVYINELGEIESIHRKIQPTYEERLVWGAGDGHGLVGHKFHQFTLGGLNCWENWLPLLRAGMYAQGVNVHIAVWPGSIGNTEDITRFIAKESRSYVISASGLFDPRSISDEVPFKDEILASIPNDFQTGGSCIAGPDGKWIVSPVGSSPELITCVIDKAKVFEERQNLDVSGHYSRPDITTLTLNKERNSIIIDSNERP